VTKGKEKAWRKKAIGMAEVRECGESVAETLDEQFNEVRTLILCCLSLHDMAQA